MINLPPFQQQLLQYSLLVKKVTANARAKDVHALRSLSRRLRAELWVLQHTSEIKVPAKVIAGLRRLTRKLGPCRQLHVLYKDALAYKLSTKSLKIKQVQCKDDLQNLLTAKWQRELSEGLQKFLIHLLKIEVQANAKKAKTLLKSQAIKLRDTPTLETPQEWHTLRKGLRKLQYRMDVLELHSEPLKDLQRLIGKAHDLHILSEYFPEAARVQKDEGIALKRARKIYLTKIQTAVRKLGPTAK